MMNHLICLMLTGRVKTMDDRQKYIFLKDLYYEGDDRVDRCYLCGDYNFVSDMKLVLGKQVCGCNEEDEDIAALVQETIEAEERRIARCKDAIDMRTLANDILGNINSICTNYKNK